MKKHEKIKNILITGGSGFIGSNFLEFSSHKRNLQDKIVAPTHKQLNISNLQQLKKFFDRFHPDVVINFAAHRNANTAELQRGDKDGSVWNTNVKGVKNISEVSREFNSFFVNISTDMVFSGHKDNPGPYSEVSKIEANFNKLSWYGWTKAEAERVMGDNKKSAIIRIGNVTQPIYDPKLDYIGKILYLFDRKKIYALFNDQYLTLTSIPSLFKVIELIIDKRKTGVFHVASKNTFTPYEMGTYLIKKTRGKDNLISKSSIDEYLNDHPNRYPKFGGLSSKITTKKLGIRVLKWEEIVDLFIASLKN